MEIEIETQHSQSNSHNLFAYRRNKKLQSVESLVIRNRIQLLEQEDQKVMRNAEETKKKAFEIYYLKLKNQVRKEIKQKSKPFERLNMPSIRSMDRQQKLDTIPVMMSKDDIQTSKKLNYQQIRSQSKANLVKTQQFRQTTLDTKNQKCVDLRLQEQQSRQRLYTYNQLKIQHVQEQTIMKLEEERNHQLRKQQEIMSLAKREEDLVAKLQKTHAFRQNAFNYLENALDFTPEKFGSLLRDEQFESQGTIEKKFEDQSLKKKREKTTGLAGGRMFFKADEVQYQQQLLKVYDAPSKIKSKAQEVPSSIKSSEQSSDVVNAHPVSAPVVNAHPLNAPVSNNYEVTLDALDADNEEYKDDTKEASQWRQEERVIDDQVVQNDSFLNK